MTLAAAVRDVLGPGRGPRPHAPGYEHREDQLALAESVARALEERRYLVAEAGTGTGKTLAYLAPALLSGRRVVVSTATKASRSRSGRRTCRSSRARRLEFEAALLKGRANYCASPAASGSRGARRSRRARRRRSGREIEAWAAETETGDRAELDLPDQYASLARDVGVGRDLPRPRLRAVRGLLRDPRARERRPGAGGPREPPPLLRRPRDADEPRRRGGAPGVRRGRLRRGARARGRRDRVLRAPRLVVARGGARARRGARGRRPARPRAGAEGVDQRGDPRRRAVLRRARGGAAGAPARAATPLPTARAAGRRGGLRSRGRRRGAPRGRRPRDAHRRDAPPARAAPGAARPRARGGPRRHSPRTRTPRSPRSRGARRSCAVELRAVTALAEPRRVFFAEARGRGVFVRAAPIDVSEDLVERLYRRVDTAVFTSATLAAQGRFDYFRRRIGLAPGARRRRGAPRRPLRLHAPGRAPRAARTPRAHRSGVRRRRGRGDPGAHRDHLRARVRPLHERPRDAVAPRGVPRPPVPPAPPGRARRSTGSSRRSARRRRSCSRRRASGRGSTSPATRCRSS